ncbi:MAG: CHAT domain-containing protein [Caldilinea sp. CFX5]|nr:CHAT domain-containing protein [Caldilinea sp. CFX5]
MTLHLSLTVDADQCVVARCGEQILGAPTPLAALPRITPDANPFRYDPYGLGRQLLAALGGPALLDRLQADADGALYLTTDAACAALAWEYAATPDRTFLATQYSFLRLLPTARPAPPARSGPLNLVALAADPLVDDQGNPRTGYKLTIETELSAMTHRLRQSENAVSARRIPPTRGHLQRALRQGPAILHLSCHGNVIQTTAGPQAILQLEDETGRAEPLRSDQLLQLPPPGVLRLAVMSACRTAASALDADLARSLVLAGVPAAVGMQGDFPDPLSDELAATLYDFLLAGYGLGEALRQARLALVDHPYAVGLPVGYVAPGGDQPLPLTAGPAQVSGLTSLGSINLPAPLLTTTFLGREAEQQALAAAFAGHQNPTGHKVVTVVGTGGIGKSALSGAFARRFGWRWPGGVIGATLADLPSLHPESFVNELLRRLLGDATAAALADQPAERQVETLLAEATARQTLVLIDNYESVLEELEERQEDKATGSHEPRDTRQATTRPDDQTTTRLRDYATRLHRLVATLARGGVMLLLTSRRQPAGLAGEFVFPPGGALAGVTPATGAAIFVQNSVRAKAQPTAHEALALAVARSTEGHPLAIALLAGEFDVSDEVAPPTFLAQWDAELAAARQPGQASHHVSFAVAFQRSFRHLSGDQQRRLIALSRFPAPFFVEGAHLLWRALPPAAAEPVAAEPVEAEPAEAKFAEAELVEARRHLAEFVRRSLLRADGAFADESTATWRLEPVIGRTLRARLDPSAAALLPAYLTYADWLVNRLYGKTGSEVALAQLAQQWLTELTALAPQQTSEEQAAYCWRLAVLLRQFGQMQESMTMLTLGEQVASQQKDNRRLSRLWQAKAELNIVAGELDEAIAILNRCIAVNTHPADEGEKSVNIATLANVYVMRGDYDQALALYQESLAIQEKLGDLQGRSATLHALANVYVTRGDYDQALALYQESLALDDKLGDIKGRSATLHALANVYRTRGDYDQALALYQESLAIQAKLGDLQGRSATLSQMANLHMAREEWEEAEALVAEGLRLSQQIGDPSGAAFDMVKLGQIAQARGDRTSARQRYEAGLAIFAQLGMPEANQVRAMLASLDQSGAGANATPAPTRAQQIAALRAQPDDRQAQEQLSILLYNHGGELAQAGRLAEAVAALEAVVALDERWGLADLAADRQVLEELRRRQAAPSTSAAPSDATPAFDPQAVIAALTAQLAELPPTEQAALRQAIDAFARASPAEQAAMLQGGQQNALAEAADELVALALAALADGQRQAVAAKLINAAAVYGENEAPGSPYQQLAALATAIAALLADEVPPPVAPIYAARLAQVQQAVQGR